MPGRHTTPEDIMAAAKTAGTHIVSIHLKSPNSILEALKVDSVDEAANTITFDASAIGQGKPTIPVDDLHYLEIGY